jgi:hypothetical protein
VRYNATRAYAVAQFGLCCTHWTPEEGDRHALIAALGVIGLIGGADAWIMERLKFGWV